MAYTRSWDAAAEASPADADNVSDGAGKIRNLKTDIRERLSKDHYFAIAGTDADHGEHNYCTLREQSSKPTVTTNKGAVYAKDVSGVTELFYENDAGTEVQITTGGKLKGSNISADAGITGSMIANNAVALTTQTTGNYVGTVAAGTGITVAEADGEGATKTVSIAPAYRTINMTAGYEYWGYNVEVTLPATAGYYAYWVTRYSGAGVVYLTSGYVHGGVGTEGATALAAGHLTYATLQWLKIY